MAQLLTGHAASMKAKTKRIVGSAVLALVVVGYALLLWRGPWWIDGAHLRTRDLQPADGVVITGFRTMLVALGAGAVAALGLYYTHKGHKQTEALFAHTRKKDREQAELTREGQVTERYVEAIKLLASTNLTERLGGIFALERIMRDSEKDHATVVEVLAAFVRQRSPIVEAEGAEPYEIKLGPNGEYVRPEDDVQAALSVLGRRPERPESFRLNLRNLDLRGVNLASARLDGADLNGAWLVHARLDAARLARTHLYGADFTDADLRGADMQEAMLEGAEFGGADLSGVCLRRAWLGRARLAGALLRDALLEDAYLRKASVGEGVTVNQLVTARIYDATKLPAELREDPRIQARIAECQRAPKGLSVASTLEA